jgi:hypothetical protein
VAPSVFIRVRQFISRRRLAYVRTFDTQSPFAEEVLRDLARFCRANASTFHPDARVEGRLDGRREVWLRIVNHLNLTDEQLWAIHAPAPITTNHGDTDD